MPSQTATEPENSLIKKKTGSSVLLNAHGSAQPQVQQQQGCGNRRFRKTGFGVLVLCQGIAMATTKSREREGFTERDRGEHTWAATVKPERREEVLFTIRKETLKAVWICRYYCLVFYFPLSFQLKHSVSPVKEVYKLFKYHFTFVVTLSVFHLSCDVWRQPSLCEQTFWLIRLIRGGKIHRIHILSSYIFLRVYFSTSPLVH